MYIEKYSKNALFLLFLIFFIAILSINSINAVDISENITTDINTHSEIDMDNDVNNAAPETSKIESNDDTRNVVVRSKEKSVEEDLIKDNDDKTPISISTSDVTMKRYDKSQLIINLNTEDPTSIEGKYVKIEMDNKIYWRPIFNSMANLTIYNDVGNYTAICSFNYTNFQYELQNCISDSNPIYYYWNTEELPDPPTSEIAPQYSSASQSKWHLLPEEWKIDEDKMRIIYDVNPNETPCYFYLAASYDNTMYIPDENLVTCTIGDIDYIVSEGFEVYYGSS